MADATPPTDSRLLTSAREAANNAYAPYSNFRVGACVLSEDASIYSGANVENASYGLAVCAERVAILTAVAAGKTRLSRLAVVAYGPDGKEIAAPPCGACRQVIAEFMKDDAVIVLADGTCMTVEELLPRPFRL